MSDANYKVALGLLLKNIQEGKPQHEVILTVGETPALLTQHGGLPQLPLVIKGKAIDKVHFDHGITKGMLERVFDIVAAARAIYQCHPDHLPGCVVIATEVHRSSPLIVVVQREKQIGRALVANEIASIYSKTGSFEQRWEKEGLLLWKK